MSSSGIDVDKRLRSVLREYYREAIEDLVGEYPQVRSIYLDILDLHEIDPELTSILLSNPDHILEKGSTILSGIHEELEQVNLRIENHPGLLPVDSIGVRHVSELVTVEGSVQSIHTVEAEIIDAVFECSKCGKKMRKTPINDQLAPPQICETCDKESLFELVNHQSTFVDVQRIILASQDVDVNEKVALPVFLDDDLVNSLETSSHVLVTGIVRLAATDTANRFSFYIDAVSVDEEPDSRPDDARDLRDVIQSRWEYTIN